MFVTNDLNKFKLLKLKIGDFDSHLILAVYFFRQLLSFENAHDVL